MEKNGVTFDNEEDKLLGDLEQLEIQFGLLEIQLSTVKSKDRDEIERLGSQETEYFEKIYQIKRKLLMMRQVARLKGVAQKRKPFSILGMVSTMREPNLKGNNLDSDSEEVDADDDSLARKWEIKADEIKVNYNDSTSKLGSGAFGVVYKGKCRGTDVAVKVLNSVSQKQIDEFKHEVSILAKLRHENILLFLGACFEGSKPTIVMEYMPNGSVYHAIRKDGGLAFKRKMMIARDTALGMYWLHKEGILHLDLKPGNLLLTSNYSVKIADFGLSQPLGNVQSVGGTPNYMAPEMFDGICDEKSDIYSFGLVLWEMMSGEYPWKDQLKKPEDFISTVKVAGKRPPMPPNVPEKLRALIESCWAQEPDDRPSFAYIVENDILSQIIIEDIIRDTEGRSFWKKTYGGRFDIPWKKFVGDFSAYLQIHLPSDFENHPKFAALKFCLLGANTNNQIVTIEAFGDLLAYYGPLTRGIAILDTLHETISTPGFFGELSRDEATQVLQNEKKGTFLMRLSKREYSGSIRPKTGDKPYIHFQVQRKVIPGGFKDGKKVPPTAVLIYEGKEYNKLIDLMKFLRKSNKAFFKHSPSVPSKIQAALAQLEEKRKMPAQFNSPNYDAIQRNPNPKTK
jgi:serine/threonine protein kinase